jgi:hypothetical protein
MVAIPKFRVVGARHSGEAAPATVNALPAVAAAAARLTDLQAKRKGLEQEVSTLQRAVYEATTGSQADDLEAEAQALAAGREAVVDQPDLAVRLRTTRRHLDVAWRAETIARDVLNAARAEASLVVNRAARPHHRVLVRRIARALAELSDAAEAEAAFRQELQRGGAAMTDLIPVMAYPHLMCGPIDSYGSPSFTWLATAARLGFVDRGENPRTMKVDS